MVYIIYWVLAYLAMKKLWWSKHVYIITDPFKTFTWRMTVAFCCGPVAIPIASIVIILELLGKKKR